MVDGVVLVPGLRVVDGVVGCQVSGWLMVL